MKRIIKKGITYAESKEADTKVRAIVESIINDVTKGGDKVIRELSLKFDNWSPGSFKLPAGQIQEIIKDLPKQVIDDIKFAQTQIRNFAEKQKEALREIEVETLRELFSDIKTFRSTVLAVIFPADVTRWWLLLT